MQADRTELQTSVQSNEVEQHKKHQKNSNKSKYIPIDEQVVFTLIDSINKFASAKEQNQIIEPCKIDNRFQKLKLNEEEKSIFMEKGGINKNQIINLLCTNIRPIPFSGINDMKMKLRSSLRKVYMSKKTLKEMETNQDLENYALQIISQTIKGYLCLNGLLKESSVPTPVQEGFYDEYNMLWKEIITILQTQTSNFQQSEKKQSIKLVLLNIWQQIPHTSLLKHLNIFKLRPQFSLIQEDRMIRILSSLLVDNKIQQCCTYYEIYLLTGRINDKPKKISIKLRQFEDFVLIPKITKSDHIFSIHVLSLLKENTELKERLLNSVQLQPSIGLRVVDLLKQDGRDYYNIYIYILRQHYKSIIYDQKKWYMVEDKLSFNKNFIEWYAEDMAKVSKKDYKQNDDRMKKIAKELKDVQNIQNLELSILLRNNIIDAEHLRLKGKQFQQIPNPLYEYDRFDCAQLVIQQISPQLKEESNVKYLRLQQYGVFEKDIHFIDQIGGQFQRMRDILLNHFNEPIGFDTEFRCVSTKYEQQGVSLIQLSTSKDHFVIDFLKLENNQQFNSFIIELLCNQNYIKVGHTVSSDIKYLRMTLKIPEQLYIKNFLDITVMFKALHPNQKYSSLAFMCLKFLNRKLSKYEQRSNWNRRPLKKTQLHYGALDAFACVLIYDKIKDDYFQYVKRGTNHKILLTPTVNQEKKVQQLEIKKQQVTEAQQSKQSNEVIQQNQQTNFVGDTYRSQRLTYNRKFQFFLKSKEPKFLVDNMLKKLSSVMRNCGLDAEYIAVRDYNLALQIAQKDQRIILTRDSKFFLRKDSKIPIYLIKQKTDSDRMFQEIKQYFKLDLSEFKTLSRCVKCNGPQLIIIPKEQAMNQIKFRYEDSKVQQFWRCTKCRQIYWQGGMFQRAKQKYANLKK